MKKIIFFIAALAFWLTTTSCIRKAQDVYGPKVTKSYKVANFDAISLSVDAEVQFIQDATTSIQITGPENKLANLQIATNGSELSIKPNKNSRFYDRWIGTGNEGEYSLKIYIHSPLLQRVTVTGSGDFFCKTPVHSQNFTGCIIGSGTLNASNITAENTEFSVSGSGDISVDDLQSASANVSITGSGDVDINGKHIAKSTFSVSGSGDMKLHLKQCGNVEATVTGSGDIVISGDVDTFKQNVYGSGDIEISHLTVRK